jgi:hypothetical protein
MHYKKENFIYLGQMSGKNKEEKYVKVNFLKGIINQILIFASWQLSATKFLST